MNPLADNSTPPSGPPPRSRRRWTRWLGQVALLLAVLWGLHAWQTRAVVDGAVPPLAGVLLDGTPVRLSELRSPVLVYFWGTWCPVCRIGSGTIQNLSRDYPVLTVAADSRDTLQAYMAEESLDFPTIADPLGDLSARFGVRGVPTSIVVDGRGTIRFKEVGYTSEWGLRLRLWLASEG
jgi:thiol-disulfide isomerase/thioredoxin